MTSPSTSTKTSARRMRRRFAQYEDVVGAPDRLRKLAADIVEHWEQPPHRDDQTDRQARQGNDRLLLPEDRGKPLQTKSSHCAPTGTPTSTTTPAGSSRSSTPGRRKDEPPVADHVRSTGAIKKHPAAGHRRRRPAGVGDRAVAVADRVRLAADAHACTWTSRCEARRSCRRLPGSTADGVRSRPVWSSTTSASPTSLTQALAEYTDRDAAEKPIGKDISAAADIVIELHGVVSSQLHGINWRSKRDSGRPRAFFHAALDVVDYLRSPEPDLEDGKPTLADRYADTARKLARAFSSCPREEKIRPLRADLEFFEAVRLYLAKLRAEERAGSWAGHRSRCRAGDPAADRERHRGRRGRRHLRGSRHPTPRPVTPRR